VEKYDKLYYVEIVGKTFNEIWKNITVINGKELQELEKSGKKVKILEKDEYKKRKKVEKLQLNGRRWK